MYLLLPQLLLASLETALQIIPMYNLHQYEEVARSSLNLRKQEHQYTRWLLKHEQLKNDSVAKVKQRVHQFIVNQSVSPSAVEDDHYRTWRGHRQFRDVEDPAKFTGFKTFRHKPHYDVGRYYNERERKQMAQLAEKSGVLVREQRILGHLTNRSLRSQGPLNLEHSFRDTKQDRRCIQPRMRYADITDKQRSLSQSVTFNDKLSQVYQKFDRSKSKIGRITATPARSSANGHMIESAYNEVDPKQKFCYEYIEQQPPSSKSGARSIWLGGQQQNPTKTYFKSAKTMAIQGCPKAQSIMHATQYDRKKDLSNIISNYHNESFCKKQVL